jgi:hypothetical protein
VKSAVWVDRIIIKHKHANALIQLYFSMAPLVFHAIIQTISILLIIYANHAAIIKSTICLSKNAYHAHLQILTSMAYNAQYALKKQFGVLP